MLRYISPPKMSQYVRVPTREGGKEKETAGVLEFQSQWVIATWKLLFLSLTLTILAGGLGILGGIHVRPRTNAVGQLDFMTPAGTHASLSAYNRTFSSWGPSSDAAWDSLFPKGVGFVQHPELSPDLSGVAVFHQLHCMNMLRIAYYAAINGTLEEMQSTADHNGRPDPRHVRHCFDYIRQALVCAADPTLEPVDMKLKGSTGWGFMRTCRNFDAVKGWSERWRSTGPSGAGSGM